MFRFLRFAMVAVGLAACVPATPTPPTSDSADGPDQCGMVELQNLVGRPVSDFETLQWTKHPVRIVRPGDMVTLDFSAARLTVWVDDGENISRMSCG